jgi:hypothetical protein
MWEDLNPREVVISVLTDSSVNIFGDHTGDMNWKFETWQSVLKEIYDFTPG